MKARHAVLAAAALAAAFAVTTESQARKSRSRIVDRASAQLAGEGAVDGALSLVAMRRADGSLTRGTLRLVASGLPPREHYRLLLDDPSDARGPGLLTVADGRSSRSGRLRVRLGKRSRPLPFGDDPALLAGMRLELRDDTGTVFASGVVPAMETASPKAVHVDGAAHACPFRDVLVEEHDFAADTLGSPPADWAVADTDASAGRTIVVDDAADDGADGQSVLVSDSDAVTTAGPSMTRAFTPQSGHVAVEFTLIPGATAGRVVAQLGAFDGTTFTPAGGLVPGAGLHEDGDIGLGGSADFGTYSAGTAVTFRIDADVAADTFDLTVDGVVVATGVALDLATPGLTAIDAVRFTTGDGVTGSAHVDGVRIIEVVQDCPPVADAGPDLTVECAGPATTVQLDGSASADPEGLALTYAWSGPFDEATASGVQPTVTFGALGTYEVTLVVNDGYQDSAPDTVSVTVEDTTPPDITAPADVTMEGNGPLSTVDLGTPVVSDVCDPAPTFSSDAPAGFPLGETTVTWTARDASGNEATATQVVTIVDTTPPELVVRGLPESLWSPNHKLVRITPEIEVSDIVDVDPVVTLEVTSSEPDDATTGDGNTSGDIVIHDAGDFELRAERQGNGSGRVYTLVFTATDDSGNSTTFETTIVVPHSQGNGNGNGCTNGNGNGHANGHSNGHGNGHGNAR